MVVRSKASQAARRLEVGYALALGAVAATAVLGHVASALVIDGLRSDAELINLSGRQRMLGQRAAKNAVLGVLSIEDGPFRKREGREAIAELKALRSRFLSEQAGLPPELREEVEKTGHLLRDLEASVEGVWAAPRRDMREGGLNAENPLHLSLALDRLSRAEAAHLRGMDRLTKLLEQYAERKQAFSWWLDLGVLLAIVGVLASGARLVVRPALRSTVENLAALEAARVAAELAAEARSRFVANVSHELRTPLNGISGMTALLERTELGRLQRRYTTVIASSAGTLRALVDDVLDFAKLESSEMTIEAIEMDLVLVVERAVALVAATASERGLELGLSIDPALDGTVIGDPLRVGQCLANLLSNAVKFTERGHVHVLVERSGHHMARFEVEDSGAGVAPNVADGLFEAFRQGDASTTRRHGGTGLGLAITRRLARAMGGEAGYIDAEGGGSRFWFEARLPPKSPEQRDLRINGGVLLLDLPTFGRRGIERWLSAWKVPFFVAHGAAEAEAASDWSLRSIGLVLAGASWTPGALFGLRALAGLEMARMTTLVPLGREHRTVDLEPHAVSEASWPLCRDALLSAVEGRDLAIREGPPGSAPLRLRALLVDDNPINLQIGKTVLEHLGCFVELAERGQEAIEILRKTSFDIVLMDCDMPDMDGLEATRRIRALPLGADVPVVALTAATLDDVRADCIEAGMNDVLGKPIDEPRLRAVLYSLVERAG